MSCCISATKRKYNTTNVYQDRKWEAAPLNASEYNSYEAMLSSTLWIPGKFSEVT